MTITQRRMMFRRNRSRAYTHLLQQERRPLYRVEESAIHPLQSKELAWVFKVAEGLLDELDDSKGFRCCRWCCGVYWLEINLPVNLLDRCS